MIDDELACLRCAVLWWFTDRAAGSGPADVVEPLSELRISTNTVIVRPTGD